LRNHAVDSPARRDNKVFSIAHVCYLVSAIAAPEAMPTGLSGGTPAIIVMAGELRSAMDLLELATDHERLVTPESRHLETRT